jgi:hypothetical protein
MLWRGIASGKNARMEWREVIGASTIAVGPAPCRSRGLTAQSPNCRSEYAYFWCIAQRGDGASTPLSSNCNNYMILNT